MLERIFLHILPPAMAVQSDLGSLLALLRPALVLTSNDVSYDTRSLVLAARARGIPTLGLIHSGLNNMHYRDFQSRRMAVWGSVHEEDFVRVLGKHPAQLVAVGNPQYDTFGQRRVGAEPSVPSCAAPGAKPPESGASPTRSSRPPRVLVITAVSKSRVAYLDLRRHWQTWKQIERVARDGVQVVIKPHPRFDDCAFYRTLKPQLSDWRDNGPGIAVAEGSFLEDLLPECDLVLVPNSPTTAALEAMLCRKPVVYIACGYWQMPFITSIVPGCLTVQDLDQIAPTVLAVLDSPRWQAQVIDQGQEFLDRFLGPRDFQATRRLTKLIERELRRPTTPGDREGG